MKTEEENKAYWFRKWFPVYLFLELYYGIKKNIYKGLQDQDKETS